MSVNDQVDLARVLVADQAPAEVDEHVLVELAREQREAQGAFVAGN